MRASPIVTPLVVLALFAGSFPFVACSSSEATTASAVDGGAVAPADPDGGTPGARRDAGGDDAGTGSLGFVFAISDSTTGVDGGTRADHRAGASFVRQTGVDTTTTSKTVGPCVVEKVGSGDVPDEVDVSAGTVRITGGTKAVALTPAVDKTYEPVTGSVVLWNGGETLNVAGDGKDVPAFKTTVVAPSKLTMTAPALPSSAATLSVTRSAPFSATWSGASSGVAVLYFEATTSSNAFSATCTFKAGDGTAQVPAAAFADFPAGEGSFNFYVKEVGVASPPGWTIRFTASSAMVDSAGAGATGAATFE